MNNNLKIVSPGITIIVILLMVYFIIEILTYGIISQYLFAVPNIMGTKMAIIAVIIFFGCLIIAAINKPEDVFNKDYIRLALTATIIIEFFIYFGAVVFMKTEVKSVSDDLVETLIIVVGAVIAFYFGTETITRIYRIRHNLDESN